MVAHKFLSTIVIPEYIMIGSTAIHRFHDASLGRHSEHIRKD